jgi:hypothetical protein
MKRSAAHHSLPPPVKPGRRRIDARENAKEPEGCRPGLLRPKPVVRPAGQAALARALQWIGRGTMGNAAIEQGAHGESVDSRPPNRERRARRVIGSWPWQQAHAAQLIGGWGRHPLLLSLDADRSMWFAEGRKARVQRHRSPVRKPFAWVNSCLLFHPEPWAAPSLGGGARFGPRGVASPLRPAARLARHGVAVGLMVREAKLLKIKHLQQQRGATHYRGQSKGRGRRPA